MASPTRPNSGDPITSAWGNAVIDQIEGRWRFVPVAPVEINNTPGVTAPTALECTNLPANDPNVRAAHCAIQVRDGSGSAGSANGADTSASLLHFDAGTVAIQARTSGVMGRGGYTGPAPVLVGGVNGRQVKWNASVAGQTANTRISCYGYWTTADV